MISIAVTALLFGASNAPPGEKFTWHDFTKAEQAIVQGLPVGFFMAQPPQRVPVGYKEPKGVAWAHFFPLSGPAIANGRRESYMACMTSPKEKGPADTLYVDWNGDKKFGKGEIAKAKTSTRFAEGGEYTFPVGRIAGSGSTHTVILVLGDNIYTFLPTGGMRGSVVIQGKTRTALLIDSNCNGSYNDQGDYIYLDNDRAASQVPGLMHFPDGSFWIPRIEPDGSRFTVVRDTRPTGTLAVKGLRTPALTLSNDQGPIFLDLKDDKATLPVGDYLVNNVSLSETDGERSWNLNLYSDGKKFTVKDGETTELNIGKPLSLGVQVGGDAANKVFSLKVKDAAGLTVASLNNDKGERPPAPVLTIKNPNGEVVKSLPFAYG